MNWKRVVLGVLLSGCASRSQSVSTPESTRNPAVESRGATVAQILASYKEKNGVAPQAIYGYQFNEKQVFLVIAPCCDRYNPLFDAAGSELCAPSGGFAGNGDGRCPDFAAKRRDEALLWKP
jgi:hypothetical protein